MSDRLTIFRLHNPTGMSNHLMSLENAVALQHITNRQTIVYNTFGSNPHPWDQSHISQLIDGSSPTPRIWELVDLPNPDKFIFLDAEMPTTTTWARDEVRYHGVQEYFYNFSTDDTDEDFFSEGRQKLVVHDDARILHFGGVNLCYYSYLLMNRSPEVEAALAAVRWKAEYAEFAERVAQYLGDFNGAHMRMTDHSHNYALDAQRAVAGFAKLEDPSKTVVICTDDPGRVPLAAVRNVLFVNDVINNEFAADFRQLPYQDSTAYGLVSLLVMTHAADFVGTPGSTYTGMVHRAMYQRGKENAYKVWHEEVDTAGSGPYTWNSWTSRTHGPAKSWWREWPESRLKKDLQ